MSRQIEELLWLFKRAELKKELYYAILNVEILKQMYARCVKGWSIQIYAACIKEWSIWDNFVYSSVIALVSYM